MSFEAQPISQQAIHHSDYLQYGCPCCLSGTKIGTTLLSIAGCSLFCCSRCGTGYLVCSDSLKRVPKSLPDYNNAIIPKQPLTK